MADRWLFFLNADETLDGSGSASFPDQARMLSSAQYPPRLGAVAAVPLILSGSVRNRWRAPAALRRSA
jgi:hypothetical protein